MENGKHYRTIICSKAKRWLEEQQVPHEMIHVGRQGISKDVIKQMLLHSENGFEDVIKKTKLKDEMEEMSFNQLVEYLAENTDSIKMPILVQGENKIFIGYHEDEICSFLPRGRKFDKMKQYYSAM